MKIVQINAVNGTGSTGRTCLELEQFFSNSNNVKIITLYASGIQSTNSIRIASRMEQSIHGLLSRVTGLQGYFSPAATRKAISILAKEKPDAVILNNTHSNYINVSKLVKYIARRNIPLVVHLDDCWYYTGKCTHYYHTNCYKWKDCCGNCPRLKEDIPSWFFDRTRKMLKDKQDCFSKVSKLCVIGVSDWIVNEAKQSYFGQSAKIIRRIYNWIDIETFRPLSIASLREKHHFSENTFIILGVASTWNDNKGLGLLLSLSKMLESDEVIVLIGKMPRIDVPLNVINIDRTDNVEELVEYYSLADVFLQASEEESFGKVVAEALSCGTPVITNRHTANAELIVRNCGLVVEDDTPESYLNAVNTIKLNGKAKYSETCRSSAIERFDKDKLISETINTIVEILKS